MKTEYRGITHFCPRWLLPTWKKFLCRKEIHCFDESWSTDSHILHCDACKLTVSISDIKEFDKNSEEAFCNIIDLAKKMTDDDLDQCSKYMKSLYESRLHDKAIDNSLNNFRKSVITLMEARKLALDAAKPLPIEED